jgi:hypothetical protein
VVVGSGCSKLWTVQKLHSSTCSESQDITQKRESSRDKTPEKDSQPFQSKFSVPDISSMLYLRMSELLHVLSATSNV